METAYRMNLFCSLAKHLSCHTFPASNMEIMEWARENVYILESPWKIIWLSAEWTQPGQDWFLSMLKTTWSCSRNSGLDSTALEHPFPKLESNNLDISQETCRDVRTCSPPVLGEEWLSWLEHSGQEGQIILLYFLTLTVLCCRTGDLIIDPKTIITNPSHIQERDKMHILLIVAKNMAGLYV